MKSNMQNLVEAHEKALEKVQNLINKMSKEGFQLYMWKQKQIICL